MLDGAAGFLAFTKRFAAFRSGDLEELHTQPSTIYAEAHSLL